MKIRPGFHVNAREKSAEYLIATDLKSNLPAGFSAGDVAYPKGKAVIPTRPLIMALVSSGILTMP